MVELHRTTLQQIVLHLTIWMDTKNDTSVLVLFVLHQLPYNQPLLRSEVAIGYEYNIGCDKSKLFNQEAQQCTYCRQILLRDRALARAESTVITR